MTAVSVFVRSAFSSLFLSLLPLFEEKIKFVRGLYNFGRTQTQQEWNYFQCTCDATRSLFFVVVYNFSQFLGFCFANESRPKVSWAVRIGFFRCIDHFELCFFKKKKVFWPRGMRNGANWMRTQKLPRVKKETRRDHRLGLTIFFSWFAE